MNIRIAASKLRSSLRRFLPSNRGPRRERIQWRFMALENRLLFDGDGLIADPAATGFLDDPTGPAAIVGQQTLPVNQIVTLSTASGTELATSVLGAASQTLEYTIEVEPEGIETSLHLSFPNDLGGRLQVGFNSTTAGRVRLFDTNGQELLTSVSDGGSVARLDLHLQSAQFEIRVVNFSSAAAELSIRFTEAAHPIDAQNTVGGFDLDGRPWDIDQGHFRSVDQTDYVVFTSGDTSASLLYFTTLSDGSISLLSESTRWDLQSDGSPLDIEVADFDNDQRDDVAVLFKDRVEIYSLLSSAPLRVIDNLGINLRAFAAGDVGADGTTEFVLIDEFNNRTFVVADPLGAATELELPNPTGDQVLAVGVNKGNIYLLTTTADFRRVQLASIGWNNQAFTVLGVSQREDESYVEAMGFESAEVQEISRYSDLQFVTLRSETDVYDIAVTRNIYTMFVWAIDSANPVGLRSEPAGEFYDVDSNGQLDIVKTNLGVALSYHAENRQREFGNLIEAEPFGSGLAIEVGDFNLDNRADLLFGVERNGQYRIESVLGTTIGGYQYEQGTSVLTKPETIHAADFNRDGINDILSFSQGGARNLLLGRGDGTFDVSTSPQGTILNFGAYSNAIVADLNGDSREDIAVVRREDGGQFALVAMLGLGNGAFIELNRAAILPATELSSQAYRLEVTDVDGDGKLDLVVACWPSNGNEFGVQLQFFENESFFATAHPSVAGRVIVPATNRINIDALVGLSGNIQPNHLLAGSLNGANDPYVDLLLGVETSGQQLLFTLTGTGNFSFLVSPPEQVVADRTPHLADIVFNTIDNQVGKQTLLLKNNSLIFRDGNVDRIVLTAEPQGRFTDVALAQDDSGRIAVIDAENRKVFVLSSDGSLQNTIDLSIANANAVFDQLLFEKFDSSAVADIVAISQQSGTLVVYKEGLESGRVVKAEALPPTSVIADFNADGVNDFATLDRDQMLVVRTGMNSASSSRVTLSPPKALNTAADRIIQQLDSLQVGDRARILAVTQAADKQQLIEIRYQQDLAGIESFDVANTLYESESGILMATGYLDGDHVEDLIWLDLGSNELFVNGTAFPIVNLVRPSAIEISDGRILILDSGSSILTVYDVAGDLLGMQQANTAIQLIGEDGVVRSLGSARSMFIADLNQDGRDDVAILNAGDKTISILYGTADGLFQNPVAIALDHRPDSLAVGDYNSDGWLDIVVLQTDERNFYEDFPTDFVNLESFKDYGVAEIIFNIVDEDIVFLFGQQNAGFTRTYSSVVELVAQGVHILPTSIDNDTNLDLFLTNQDGDVLLYSGTGQRILPIETSVTEVESGIVSGSIRLTVNSQTFLVNGSQVQYVNAATSNPNEGHVNVRDVTTLEDGAQSIRDVGGDIEDKSPTDVRIAELSPGNLFLVYTVGASNQLVTVPLFYQNGQLLADAEFETAIEVGTQPRAFELKDLNGDGLLDAIVANEGSQDVTVLFGTGVPSQPFSSAQRLNFADGVGAGFRPTEISFVNEAANADMLVTFTDLEGVVQYVSVPNVGNGFFNDANAIAGPGNLSDVAFAGGQAFELGLDGSLRRFSFATGIRQSVRSFGNNSVQIRSITVEGIERIGVATANQFFAFNLNGSIAAQADTSLVANLNDFVFYDPTGLLYLVDSNEVITTLELNFITENLDRGGILSQLAKNLSLTSFVVANPLFSIGNGTNSEDGEFLIGTGAGLSLEQVFELLPPESQVGVFLKEISKLIQQTSDGVYLIVDEFCQTVVLILPEVTESRLLVAGQAFARDVTPQFLGVPTQIAILAEPVMWMDWLRELRGQLVQWRDASILEFDFENNTIRIGDQIVGPDDDAIRQFLLLENGLPSPIPFEKLRNVELRIQDSEVTADEPN